MAPLVFIPHPSIVWISGSIFCKTPESLLYTLKTLRHIGYEVTDNRLQAKQFRTTPDAMERQGYALWSAKLDVHRGKCDACQAYISLKDIETHNHRCERCGVIMYEYLAKGIQVSLEFPGREGMQHPPFRANTFTVQRWDVDEGWLYLYRFPRSLHSNVDDEIEMAKANYLDQHSDQWTSVVENDELLLRVRYYLEDRAEQEQEGVTLTNVSAPLRRYTQVRLWQGKEYGMYDSPGKEFPFPDFIGIYEAWHWAPLQPSPDLFERLFHVVAMPSNPGYYANREGTFVASHFEDMGRFVEHFTTLDHGAWQEASQTFPTNGNDTVIAVKEFCSSPHPS